MFFIAVSRDNQYRKLQLESQWVYIYKDLVWICGNIFIEMSMFKDYFKMFLLSSEVLLAIQVFNRFDSLTSLVIFYIYKHATESWSV